MKTRRQMKNHKIEQVWSDGFRWVTQVRYLIDDPETAREYAIRSTTRRGERCVSARILND